MKDEKHIEELFRQSFKDFEGEVDPQLWQNISSRLQPTASAPHAGNGGASSFGKIISGITGGGASTWIASVVAIVAVSASVWYFISSEKQQQNELKYPAEIKEPVKEEVSSLQNQATTSQEITSASEQSFNAAAKKDNKHPKANSINEEKTPVNSASANVTATEPAVSDQSAGNSVQDVSINSSPEKNETVSEPNPKERIVEITASVQSGKAPLEVIFNVFGSLNSFSIDFGDGEKSTSYNSTHVFQTPGNYDVALSGTDGAGNAIMRTIAIEVLPGSEKNEVSFIETPVPNVFTPNGDGINDEFKIKGSEVKTFQCIIYSTKGKEVYRWNGIDGSWNGKLASGLLADSGHYYIKIIAISNDGRNFKHDGILQLIK